MHSLNPARTRPFVAARTSGSGRNQRNSDKPKYCQCTANCRSFIRRAQRKRHYRLVANDADIQPSISGSGDETQASRSSDGGSDSDGHLPIRRNISQDFKSRASGESSESVNIPHGDAEEEYHADDGDDGSQFLSDDEFVDSDTTSEDFSDEFLEHGYDPDEDIDYPKTMDEIVSELEGMMGPDDENAMFDIREC